MRHCHQGYLNLVPILYAMNYLFPSISAAIALASLLFAIYMRLKAEVACTEKKSLAQQLADHKAALLTHYEEKTTLDGCQHENRRR